jgi:hypothetical protein
LYLGIDLGTGSGRTATGETQEVELESVSWIEDYYHSLPEIAGGDQLM